MSGIPSWEIKEVLDKVQIVYPGAIPLTMEKASAMTGLSEEYLRRMTRSGKLFSKRPTGKVLLTDTISLTNFYLGNDHSEEANALRPAPKTRVSRKLKKL
jgi:hypothetical protein